VNILVRDTDLAMEDFSWWPEKEASEAAVTAFSTSSDWRFLKPNLGKMFLMDDLPLEAEEEEGLGASTEREVTRKFTFFWLGVGLGVSGILIPTKSRQQSSDVVVGISNWILSRFHSLFTCEVSPVTPIVSSTYKHNNTGLNWMLGVPKIQGKK